MSPSDPKVRAFLDDIFDVYKKHGLSISHEDSQGAFIIEGLYTQNINWLKDAHVILSTPERIRCTCIPYRVAMPHKKSCPRRGKP